jgi:sugar phosphate isomerase/epimerase
MLGLGSYAYRWSCGFRDRVPAQPLGPVGLVERAAALGLGLVQFADNIPLHRRAPAEIDALRDAAQERGVAVELGLAGFDGAALSAYLDLAGRLDARLLRVATDAEDAREDAAAIAARLRAVLPAARDRGVRLALENHFFVPSPKLREIVERVDDPAVGVCLDVANSICAGEWPAETVALLAPFAINLHLKDYRIDPDPYGVGFRVVGAPLGEGVLDVAAVLAALRAGAGGLNVILEHWLPHPGGDDAAARAEDDWIARSVAAARGHGL